MRRVATALALCAAMFAAACSDDAPHGAQTADGTQQAGSSAGAASAFNSAAPDGHPASDAAAPLA
ncbi:hypothetical protein, partial [Burkholderia sp. Ac-20353]|uniref:hypothetical protein n=1 Tax=Burkholderia sp. Ac-20353 TaxID=2703894 RepID=UPI00197C4503